MAGRGRGLRRISGMAVSLSDEVSRQNKVMDEAKCLFGRKAFQAEGTALGGQP